MPTVAIDPEEVRDYTLKADEGLEGAPVFTLGVIPGPLRAFIDDKFLKHGQNGSAKELETREIHQKLTEFVRFGLRSWRNFKDKRGNEIPFALLDDSSSGFKRKVVDPACLERLDGTDLMELGLEIISRNTVTEEAKKSFP